MNYQEDIRNTPLFAFLVEELRAMAGLIADRDLDLRTLHRRVNVLEQYRAELEWRMESYEAFVQRMLLREPDTSEQVVQEIVGDTQYYDQDLLNMLMEVQSEDEEEIQVEDDDFDWDNWFPEVQG